MSLGLGPDGTLTKELVIESWGDVIEKAQGKAEEIFGNSVDVGLRRDDVRVDAWLEKRSHQEINRDLGQKIV